MNVFLVPAPPENVKQTIAERVDFERAAPLLEVADVEKLTAALRGRVGFNCWAATCGRNTKNFKLMLPGDELLFAVTGTGYFQWRAQVITTLISSDLGNELWPSAGKTGNQRSRGDKPWSLIYVVGGLQKIHLQKRKVLEAFGYRNQKDELGSLRRIRAEKIKEILDRFGTFERFLGAIDS